MFIPPELQARYHPEPLARWQGLRKNVRDAALPIAPGFSLLCRTSVRTAAIGESRTKVRSSIAIRGTGGSRCRHPEVPEQGSRQRGLRALPNSRWLWLPSHRSAESLRLSAYLVWLAERVPWGVARGRCPRKSIGVVDCGPMDTPRCLRE